MTADSSAPTTSSHQKTIVIDRRWPLIAGLICGAIALLLLGFLAGRSFERRRLRHFDSWNANYENNFFGMRPGMMRPPRDRADFPNTNGILGKILAVNDNKLTVQAANGYEQSVIIAANTNIRKNSTAGTKDDLKTGQQIAVFGDPDGQGQINAALIRIFNVQ